MNYIYIIYLFILNVIRPFSKLYTHCDVHTLLKIIIA